MRIATTAHRLARTRLRTETFGWAEEVIELAREAGNRRLPLLLAAASDSATSMGRVDDAVRFGREAVSLNDDARYDPDVLVYVQTGFALMTRGDVDGSLRVLRTGAQHPTDRVTRVSLGDLHGVRFPDDEIDRAVAELAATATPSMQAAGFWVQALKIAENDIAAAIALYQRAIDTPSTVGDGSWWRPVAGSSWGCLLKPLMSTPRSTGSPRRSMHGRSWATCTPARVSPNSQPCCPGSVTTTERPDCMEP